MSRNSGRTNGSLPPNVYLFKLRIAGIEITRVFVIVVLVSMSAFIFQYDEIFSLVFFVTTVAFTLFRHENNSLGVYLLRILLYSLRRKEGTLSTGYLIENQNGLSFLIGNDKIALVALVIGYEVSILKKEYTERYLVTIKGILDDLDCNIETIGIPYSVDSGKYKVDGDDDYVRYYNDLVDYVFTDCYYYDVYLILKTELLRGKEILTMSKLEEDFKKIKNRLLSVGFQCEVVSEKQNLEIFLKELQ